MAEEKIENAAAEPKEEELKNLDPRLIKQLESAEKTIDQNPQYTIDVCRTILARHPSCVEVRKIMRVAQFKKFGKGNPVAKMAAKVQGLVFAAKSASALKKGDEEAALKVINEAEDLLCVCPENSIVLKTLAAAAAKLEYWGTASSCYKAISEFEPNNLANLVALGNAYLKDLKPDEAIQIGDLILRKNPGNGEAQAIMRSASVIKTMEKGKWEEKGDFKEKLKSKEETSELETGIVNDDEALRRMIEKLKAQIETDPENVNLYREICSNLRSLRRYSEAVEYVRKAREQPLGRGDTTLEKMEHDFIIADMNQRIDAIEKIVSEGNATDEQKAELEKLRIDERKYKLENAKMMVEKYPNDFNSRYVLGQLMLEEGNLDEAIMQFQLSQRNPKVRSQSLLGLGEAFLQGGKYDLAVEQLVIAKKELPIMNDAKKEIIYQLANAYEKMKKPEEAFREYKEIYSSDISFKDVAEKINAYYASKA